MTVSAADAAALRAMLGHFKPRERRWATPGVMAQHLDPRTVQTPALELIDAALVDVAEGRCDRLIISMPPQEGKSQRVSRRFPLWLLAEISPELRIAIASYEHGVARRWGRDIRNDITTHGTDLHLTVREDTSAAHEWQLAGHQGGVYCVGIGGALTGRPVDILVIDDPVKGPKEADSSTYRETAWDWWESVASTRLSPGAPVILIMTRWHEDDLAGRFIDREPGVWRVINIPAQADHRPEKGEQDPLGRPVGEFLQSARRRTVTQWEKIKLRGARVWNALYQGRPAPAEGAIFKTGWWQFYDAPQWGTRADGSQWAIGFDEIIASWDLTFKDTDGTDYVCGQVWGRRGADAYLLDQVHDRMSFVETCLAVRRLAARWPQAAAKLVEDKANGPAVINALGRIVPGLIAIEPEGSKVARAAAVSPFVEARNVYLPAPEIAPWVDALIEEAAGFPAAAHDDRVDAMSQALNRLLLNPLLSGDVIVEDETYDDFAISPY